MKYPGVIPPEMMAFVALRYVEEHPNVQHSFSKDTLKKFVNLMERVKAEIDVLKVIRFFTILMLL